MLALVDTGAGSSVISERLIRKLGMKIKPLDKNDLSVLSTADGNLIKVKGKVCLSIKLNGLTVPYDFLVVPAITEDLILGIDFLSHTKAEINCSDRTVTFFNDMVSVNILNGRNTTVALITNDCVLPPRSETVVEVTLSHPWIGDLALIEPLPPRFKQKYSVSRLISKPNLGKTCCKILNPTNIPLKLHKNLAIAKIEEVQAENIFELEERKGISGEIDGKNEQTEGRREEKVKLRTLEEIGLKVKDENLTKEQQQRLRSLLENNTDLFATSLKDLPGTNLYYHEINTGDAVPVRQRPFKYSPAAKKELDKQIKEMLDCGIIVPSNSLWSSAAIIVRKKDNSYRFCVDYRKLNAVSKQISWPLPLLTDVVDALSENHPQFFSCLDMKSGYFQCPLHPNSRSKTAFSTCDANYEWTRMPQGLSSSTQGFQMLMTQVFKGMLWKSVACYIDDLVIFSKDFDTHMQHLQEVFDRLRSAQLRLHPKKCQFALQEIPYLGHIINTKGIAVDESKITAVKNWPQPKSIKDVRSFLGYCGYYRKFVKSFAKIAGPLYNLLKKDKEFQWDKSCQEAFETLRTAMTTTPVLAYADMNKEFIISTDASRDSIGYILSQVQDGDGEEHPISFGGRSLRQNERNWSVTHIECLALMEAVREYSSYLSYKPFKVITDHISLKWLNSIRDTNIGRLQRWALLLQSLKFNIVHKQGRAHANADGLSRRPYPPPPPEDPDDDIVNDVIDLASLNVISQRDDQKGSSSESGFESPEEEIKEEDRETTVVYFKYNKIPRELSKQKETETVNRIMTIDNLAELQRDCPDLNRIILYLQTGELPVDAKLARQTVHEANEYFFKGEILHHHYTPNNKRMRDAKPVVEQIVIPSSLRMKILQQYHDDLGHNGHDRTYLTIRSKYHWPGMYQQIRKYCKTCMKCQKIKFNSHFKKAPLHPWQVASCCSRWHIDITTPHVTVEPEGWKHILVCVDSFSRFPECHPLKTQTATEICDVLYNQVFCRYGMPEAIHSDRGAGFISQITARMCKMFDIRKMKTSSYRPQANSCAENFNRTIWKGLKAYCDKQDRWSDYLQSIMLGYRSTVSAYSTQFTPYFLMFGRNIRLPIDNDLKPTDPEKRTSVDAYIDKVTSRIKIMQEVATKNVEDNQTTYKEKYDRTAKPSTYVEGDLVWLYTPHVKPGTSSKMAIKYTGPYYVVRKISESNYLLNDCKTHKRLGHPIHSDRLKPCYNDRDVFFQNEQYREAENAMGEGNEQQRNDENDQQRTTEDKEQENTQSKTIREEETISEDNREDTTNETKNDAKGVWCDALELTGCRKIGKTKYYKVKWADPDAAQTWEKEDDITDILKQNYHIKRTLKGKVRKHSRKTKNNKH